MQAIRSQGSRLGQRDRTTEVVVLQQQERQLHCPAPVQGQQPAQEVVAEVEQPQRWQRCYACGAASTLSAQGTWPRVSFRYVGLVGTEFPCTPLHDCKLHEKAFWMQEYRTFAPNHIVQRDIAIPVGSAHCLASCRRASSCQAPATRATAVCLQRCRHSVSIARPVLQHQNPLALINKFLKLAVVIIRPFALSTRYSCTHAQLLAPYLLCTNLTLHHPQYIITALATHTSHS